MKDVARFMTAQPCSIEIENWAKITQRNNYAYRLLHYYCSTDLLGRRYSGFH